MFKTNYILKKVSLLFSSSLNSSWPGFNEKLFQNPKVIKAASDNICIWETLKAGMMRCQKSSRELLRWEKKCKEDLSSIPQARGVLWAKPGKSTRERDHTVRQNSWEKTSYCREWSQQSSMKPLQNLLPRNPGTESLHGPERVPLFQSERTLQNSPVLQEVPSGAGRWTRWISRCSSAFLQAEQSFSCRHRVEKTLVQIKLLLICISLHKENTNIEEVPQDY